jgi:hypothetical protein
MTTDLELATTLTERLNALILNDNICKDVAKLIETRVLASQTTAEHPSIQVEKAWQGPHVVGPKASALGFLGLLNGIVGTIPDGPNAGQGYIKAVFNDKDELLRFEVNT